MATLMREFASALAGVERPGDFSTTGVVELSAPGLVVEGVGPVALPLLPVQAAALVGVAAAAPFGRGEATIVDRDVRRTWQIDPGKVRIVGRHWPACLDRIVTSVASGLGVDTPVEAQFYKLLTYDQGSFFVGHRDTEKTPGMFATLVIVLPSLGKGGELVVRHQGREVRYELATDDPGEAAFAAFYADCVHEVLPITSGHRLTLVYNLVRRGGGKRLEPPRYESEVARLANLLRRWAGEESPQPRSGDEPSTAVAASAASPEDEDSDEDEFEGDQFDDDESDDDAWENDDSDDEDDDAEHHVGVAAGARLHADKIVYPLEHAYTPAELSFAALKGADAAAAGVMISAAEQAACDLHLALLVVEEDGAAEHTGYGRSRRSRYDDEDEDEFEIGEIFDTQRTLSDWRRPDSVHPSLGPIPVLEEELSPPDAFEDVKPDESHFHEATGNEGASFERTYRRAALVVWPRARTFAVLAQAGLVATIPALRDMVADPARWPAARDLAGHMIASWPRRPSRPKGSDASDSSTFLGLLGELGDPDLIRRFLGEVATAGGCDRNDNPAILAALSHLPERDRIGVLTRIVAARAKTAFADCADLLERAVREPKVRPHDLAEAAAALVGGLPGDPAVAQWGRVPRVEAGVIADLTAVLPAVDEEHAAEAVDHMLRWPKAYDLDEVIVPGLCEGAAGPAAPASPSVERLRAVARAHLDARIAEPLEKPTDYRRDPTLGCSCKDCAAVAAFLADPVQRTWTLKAPQHARDHVEHVVGRAQADVGCTTETKGRPYTLVLTKNQASYARRSRQRDIDLRNRAALGR